MKHLFTTTLLLSTLCITINASSQAEQAGSNFKDIRFLLASAPGIGEITDCHKTSSIPAFSFFRSFR